MKRTLLSTAAFIFAGHMAFAAISSDSVVTSLLADGYTRVEVKQGPMQIKVEAIRGTEKLEIVYDIETGAILKQEVETVRPGENTAPGVSIRDRDEDFVDGEDDSNDDDEDDDNDNDDDTDDSDDDNDDDDNSDDDSDDDGDDDSVSDDDGDDD